MKSIEDMRLKSISVMDRYSDVYVSISGGSDSDIMIDLIEDIKPYINSNITYLFVDTGLEYAATKEHIEDLQCKYKCKIEIIKPEKTIPNVIKKYGQPFISKRVSDYISRLQQHNFKWENENFDILYKKYPHCKAALRWYCNNFEHPKYNICQNKGLKDFLIMNPLNFKVSKKCCDIVKKRSLSQYKGLHVIGIRKCEGGARNDIKSCWDIDNDLFYPLLFMNKAQKEQYENDFGVTHSKCYTEYGLQRTGCAGCPFGQHYQEELKIIRKYEPKLYNACINLFGESYNATNQYLRER